MSLFTKIFGAATNTASSKTPAQLAKTTDRTIDSIDNLNTKEEQLEKKRQILEKKMEEEVIKAKQFLKEKKKAQATMCLKKKKMYEHQVKNKI